MRCKDQKLGGFGVSVVITSCKRHDLLYTTLRSFVACNTYPIEKIIIIEDSSNEINRSILEGILHENKSMNYATCELICLINAYNLGQMGSIDKAYKLVNSEFIFHCEDDWMFHKPGFIERSFEILNFNENIFTVWLRGHADLNGHKIGKPIHIDESKSTYHEITPMGIWTGFTLNPGLRRTADCLLLHPYALQQQVDPNLTNRNGVTESDLSILYGEQGFKAAVTSEVDGFIYHIGDGHHIAHVWENAFSVKIKNLIKRILK